VITYEQARQHPEYSRIPEHILHGVYAYVDQHQATGHFLACVLSNDLFGAVARADKEAGAALRELVVFITNEVPLNCYGSADKIKQWLNVISWTPAMLARFKEAYALTVAMEMDTFIFEGNEFVVDYAKYLIQHLDTVFKSHTTSMN
jgi:hypothetical protein